MYMDAREIYCSPSKLAEYLVVNNSNYLELDYSAVPDFWHTSSAFACSLNRWSMSDLGAFLASSFTLPDNVKDVKHVSSLIFCCLKTQKEFQYVCFYFKRFLKTILRLFKN